MQKAVDQKYEIASKTIAKSGLDSFPSDGAWLENVAHSLT
jgi:hypothetical protein